MVSGLWGRSPQRAIPEEIKWDEQPRGHVLGKIHGCSYSHAAPWGCLPMDSAEWREEQGWTKLGTKPASDTSTPGFNWVPFANSLFAPQDHSCQEL